MEQGIECEGYPLNIKMYGMEGGALRKSRPRTRRTSRATSKPKESTDAASATLPSPDGVASTSGSSTGTELQMPAGYSQGIPLSTANLKLRNDEDVQGLLTYCKLS